MEAFNDNLMTADEYFIENKSVINKEFPRTKGCIYVDHAGAALYSESQMKAIFSCLTNNLYGNPHSGHGPSDLSAQAVDAVRNRILDHFNTDSKKYSLIFTSGATAAIKLVGEYFRWNDNFSYKNGIGGTKASNNGVYVYTTENHTSVLGIRQYTMKSGSNSISLPMKQLSNIMEVYGDNKHHTESNMPMSLLAYPAQCNYSGAKYPLSLINHIHRGQLNSFFELETLHDWYVLLDAAGLVGTCELDLSKYSPDFVPISFYKIFGYPTGIGCLLVSKRGEKALRKDYFGGGTVAMVDASSLTVHRRSEINERFEDGSLPFLSIISLEFGLNSIKRLTGGIKNIEIHTFNVAKYLFLKLKKITHGNGNPVVEVYCESDQWTVEKQGGIVNFNLLDENGHYVGYSQVEKISSLYNICLRTGCMCNPGACQRYLNISSKLLKEQFDAGHVCGDAIDLVENCPTGSIRVSFGYPSTYEDADVVIKMITECFVTNISSKSLNCKEITNDSKMGNEIVTGPDIIHPLRNGTVNLVLTDILVYPVKSCAPMIVNRWNIGSSGMEYDRHWMIITTAGVTMTQKRMPKMAFIFPRIDLPKQKLILSCNGFKPCELPIEYPNEVIDAELCSGRICGDRIKGIDCGQIAANWLAQVLDRSDIRLLRMASVRKARLRNNSNESESLSLSNESQFLVINRTSLRLLQNEIGIKNNAEALELEDLIYRFRPNLVVDGGDAFSEDKWKQIKFGTIEFQVKGLCTRCQIVCVSPKTAERSKEPLLTLSSMRGSSAKFGVHVFHEKSGISPQLYTGLHGVADN